MSRLPLSTRRLITWGPLLIVLGLSLVLGQGGDAGGYVVVLGALAAVVGLHRLGRAGPDQGRLD